MRFFLWNQEIDDLTEGDPMKNVLYMFRRTSLETTAWRIAAARQKV